jgi:hypothetical protein
MRALFENLRHRNERDFDFHEVHGIILSGLINTSSNHPPANTTGMAT